MATPLAQKIAANAAASVKVKPPPLVEMMPLEPGPPAGARELPGKAFLRNADIQAVGPHTPGLSPLARFKGAREYISVVLRKLSIWRSLRVPWHRAWLSGILKLADAHLGARRCVDLTNAQLAAFVSEVRIHLLEGTRAWRAERAAARVAAGSMKGAVVGKLERTHVDTPGGIWTFFHTGGAGPVVVREVFTPVRATVVPQRPAFPGPKPRWLGRSGKTYKNPPPVADKPPATASDIPAALLRDAPHEIVEQLFRTETGQLAGRRMPVTDKKVDFIGDVPPRARVTLGYGIDAVIYGRKVTGGAYDQEVTVEGTIYPSVPRVGDEGVLPVPGLLGLIRYVRAHLFGPIFGDTTPAGIAFAPEAFNQYQLSTIESFLKAGRRGSAVGAKLRATARLQYRTIMGQVYPFIRSAIYEITIEGRTSSFEIFIDDAGGVSGGSRGP